ncbi:hypothetical protein BH24ACT23_BH24ACT23_05180 [soil metagenome]
MRRVVIVAVALACLGTAGTADAEPRGPLSHQGRWITDRHGRVVTLHGWNMVYKVGSYRPADAGFGRNDIRFLRRHGFNTIRLGIIQNGVEPELPDPRGKPRYRNSYLDSIARTERKLARNGMFTLLDVHQDLYNERFQGEGFPDWAVVGDAATLPAEPKQGFPANYLVMPALGRAYDHLWLNDSDAAGRPLQDSFAAMWRHIAKRFEGRRKLVGYNILNEPWPGSQYPSCISNVGCPLFDTQFLEPFTERAIAAIRKTDRRTLVWYAPLLLFDFGADTSHGDTGDQRAGFAFNMYCLAEVFPDQASAIGDGVCDTGYGLTLANAEDQSAETGDALLLTEYAATDDLAAVEDVAEAADEAMIGWQQWHYCDCDDPTTTGTTVQSLVSDANKPPRGRNLNRNKLRVSSRPFPQAVAGTPLAYDFDRDQKRFDLTYSTTDSAGHKLARQRKTEVFIPPIHYRKTGYRAAVEGATVVSRRNARVLKLKRRKRAAEVTLVVEPRG